jgi:hypothetical protein
MPDDERLEARLEVRLYRSEGSGPGRREVGYDIIKSGLSESILRHVAWYELARRIGAGFRPSPTDPGAALGYHPATFDWRRVFKAGDVVRSRIDGSIGVVLGVVDSGSEMPMYDLHVDTARDRMTEGVGVWPPWVMDVVEDPEVIAEARRLGLRGLDAP